MKNHKSLYQDEGVYKGKKYIRTIYPLNDWKKLPKVDQVHAVCFLSPEEVVFYKNVKGYVGNPGGGPEGDEEPEETIRRELIEEGQLKLLDWTTIGYEQVDYVDDEGKVYETSYFLRTVAKVDLIDAEVKDPDGKGVGRVVVPIEEAKETLGWGKSGDILIDLACSRFEELEI
jgi:8-oxo-dGTP pyrophosphatase MutT (NUDIX family)